MSSPNDAEAGKVKDSDDTAYRGDSSESCTASDTSHEPLFQFMSGIQSDLKAYLDDWSRPKSIVTVVNATLYAFVIQLIPALIFAELMNRETEGNIATAEVLMSSAIIGIIYAIFAGQPLTIMGITGPVALLLGTSYGLTERFDAEYFPFFFWVCLWAGLMHIISAMIGLVSLVWTVTPFTSQIFELFIATTFIYSSLRDLIEPIYFGQPGERDDRAAQYAGLMLGLLTFFIAWTLHFAETWTYFTREIRVSLTAYNTLIATSMATAVSFLPGIALKSEDGKGELDRVRLDSVPWDWTPSADRPWLTNPLEGIDARGIIGAFIPGLMFFLLFIIDHNVSSILTQSPKFNLRKPSAYHWDFLVLGITFIPCAMLGLPPDNGLIPQAPLHCRALCPRKFETDEHGIRREIVTHCEEQRFSALGQALLMFVALSAFRVISWIPRGVLFGLFFYLGVVALHGNEIWERILMCFKLPKKRPGIPVVTKVSSWGTTQLFTIIQACCALLIFAVGEFTSFGYLYPVLLVMLVPLRSYILSQIFSEDDLKHLDPAEETEEEYEEEQKAFFRRNNSFNEADLVICFRGMGGRPTPKRRHSIGHTNDLVPDDAAANLHAHISNHIENHFEKDPTMALLNAARQSEVMIQRSRHSRQID